MVYISIPDAGVVALLLLRGGDDMNPSEVQKEILLTQVRSLIQAYEERFGSDPYVNLELESLTVLQLSTIRRNLHEVLYVPPPRK